MLLVSNTEELCIIHKSQFYTDLYFRLPWDQETLLKLIENPGLQQEQVNFGPAS